MVRHFLKFELMETFTGARFIIVFLMSSLLIISSIFAGYLKYEEALNWQTRALAANKTALEDQGSWRAMQNLGSKATRHPGKLGILAGGVDGAIGKSAYATPSANMLLRDARDELNPVYSLLNELDLGFVIQVILSLFAILYSFSAISGERERGTLKMILSNSVSRVSILVGKFVGNLIVLTVSLVIPVLLSLLLVEVLFNTALTGEEWLRVAMILLGGVLYLSLFYAIGLLISALTKRSVVSFTLCLLVWVSLVAIIPKLSVDFSRTMNDVPTPGEMEREIAVYRHQRWQDELKLLNDYTKPVMESQLGKVYDRDLLSQATQRAQDEAFSAYMEKEEQLVQDYERRLRNRTANGEALSQISPASVFQTGAMRLAQTDAFLRFRFLALLQEYRKEFQNYTQNKIDNQEGYSPSRVVYNLSTWTDDDGIRRYKLETFGPTEKLDISDAPAFTFTQPGLLSDINAVTSAWAILAIETLIIFLAAAFAFNRYDAR